jgi:hypothetical protein
MEIATKKDEGIFLGEGDRSPKNKNYYK